MDFGGEAGPRVVGRYLLGGPFAEGGIATVHFGRVLEGNATGRVVAIKRPHERYVGDPECATLFREEGRLAMRIHHPNVVPMLDVVDAGAKELLLVMEYVEGETLGSLVRLARKSGARIPMPVVGALMKGMLAGLEAAHGTRGDSGEPLLIVHRDVSPHNVIVGVDGRARVLDFGVAKAVGRVRTIADEPMTGKLAYMAPEQVRGASVDHRADLYGAAILLWETLTQKRLFTGETDRAIIMAQLTHAPAKPSSVSAEIPEAIDAVAQKGLAKVPEQRYASAAEMARDVEGALGCAEEAEVAAWLKELAERSLARRAERYREIAAAPAPAKAPPPRAALPGAPSAPTIEIAYEDEPEPSPAPLPEAAPRPEGLALPTPTELVLDVPPPAPRRRRLAAGAVVVFALAAAVALTIGLRAGDEGSDAPAAPVAGEPLPPAPSPLPSAVPAAARSPIPSASASASAAPSPK